MSSGDSVANPDQAREKSGGANDFIGDAGELGMVVWNMGCESPESLNVSIANSTLTRAHKRDPPRQ
jgi:hypothetical protein